MEAQAINKPSIFISYSHKDIEWKERLQPHLKILEKVNRITIWDDKQIDRDGKYYDKIKEIIYKSAVTICLISADYLASDFGIKEEISYLFECREKEGMIIIPILLRPCAWKVFPWLRKPLMLPRDDKSVSEDFKDKWDGVFTEVTESILKIIENPNYTPPKPAPNFSPPEKIDINRLPMTGEELFGRQKELEMLDKAWESNSTHIISLVAWGGMGKSILVNKWLERMKAENFRGAARVFAWTFHSQGSGEKVTSADLFFSEALSWFGDPDPVKGSPWDKGARLADLIRKKKTLLVLDGLEPLQSPYEYEHGKLKDPGMATLLSELARKNIGMCIITTREEVADLSQYSETVIREDLMKLSPEAGRALLRFSGVQGTDAELEAATGDFGSHALAFTLLGVYLHGIPGHHISNASSIPDLDIPEAQGRHPRRIMAAFEKLFGEGAEVELLRVLGLFNRPADGGAIAALKSPPSIKNLTEHIQKLSESDWRCLLQKLRENRLIAPESRHEPDTLDAHPLIREHFGEELRRDNPTTWKEAHSRLYEYYKAMAKKDPQTIEDVMPLYFAVAHGCEAQRHQEAWDVYKIRIGYSSKRKTGAFGADLSALSGFFEKKWSHPVPGLREIDKVTVLNEAGYDFRALGMLKEAAQLMKASLEASVASKDPDPVVAGNLSELYLTMGNISSAIEYARKSIEFADRSRHPIHRIDWCVNRTMLADALHQAGYISEAEALFRDAETMLTIVPPYESTLLDGIMGFRYHNLLLSQGKYLEVQDRANKTIKFAKQAQFPLDIGLDHISIGRSYLLQFQKEKRRVKQRLLEALHKGSKDFASMHLNQAMDCLRKAAEQEFMPHGLLARAELNRVVGEFQKAKRDLDEAVTIAERGEMGLHKADCRLGYARLHLAMGDKEKARGELAAAKEMIGKMGYHRRDNEVKELEKQL